MALAKSDPARQATGIRPSLHPVTINALSEALKIRARNLNDMPLSTDSGVKPLQVALTAGRIASDAIHKRQQASGEDGMKLLQEEQQTIAGRVVGVVMRLPELESELYGKCESVSWIAKYNEWSSFGILKEEDSNEDSLTHRILSDPLFALSRAECLLALYLHTVEKPNLDKIGGAVPDGSKIDFLDADRREVLLD
ncbi:hypothetical protein ACA910_000852 [Epithemia clementina (nom. ined.)]